jgi:sugar phosphate permease
MNASITIKCATELTIDQSAVSDLEAVYGKIAKRIIPFLTLLFTMAYVDRNNLGFAHDRMILDLKFSQTIYGFGAGIMYLGYALFEIPSNLLLPKIGARRTFARITILWGITSLATMFVKTPMQFYILRFLLGSFEAGMFPGALLYLTYWFPSRRGAQMVSLFATSMPISNILSGAVSPWIMGSMGGRAGLANWQWLFMLEGIPSIVLGILALLIMVDKPAEAGWLTEGDKRLLLADLEVDRRATGPREHGFGEALKLPKLWLLTVIRFCGVSANLTVIYWLPSIIKDLGVESRFTTGILFALPSVAGLVGLVLLGRHSDRTGERRYHCALAYLASGLGLIGTGFFVGSPVLAFVCVVMTIAGPMMANGPFWQIPRLLLAGPAAAGGIALINSIGSLSGWIGPSALGWLQDVTGKVTTGLYVLAGLEILATVLILLTVPRSVPITATSLTARQAPPTQNPRKGFRH